MAVASRGRVDAGLQFAGGASKEEVHVNTNEFAVLVLEFERRERGIGSDDVGLVVLRVCGRGLSNPMPRKAMRMAANKTANRSGPLLSLTHSARIVASQRQLLRRIHASSPALFARDIPRDLFSDASKRQLAYAAILRLKVGRGLAWKPTAPQTTTLVELHPGLALPWTLHVGFGACLPV